MRWIGQAAVVIALGALAGMLSNSVSPRRIPLVGEWRKAYGVPSPGGAGDPTRGNVEIGLGETARLLGEGALILDARTADRHAEGHIPGALPVPETRWRNLPPDIVDAAAHAPVVIAYCESMECDEAHLLATALRHAGVGGVRVFAGGMAEWRAEGRPVESWR
ncbi:MAG: rhodanese-like domain-containing protein [bacterium]|nr:rhodanese-like domain-containing protein [bacterium]